jgi:hypothetical protein
MKSKPLFRNEKLNFIITFLNLKTQVANGTPDLKIKKVIVEVERAFQERRNEVLAMSTI